MSTDSKEKKLPKGIRRRKSGLYEARPFPCCERQKSGMMYWIRSEQEPICSIKHTGIESVSL